jgi:TM2 domain-containing membrane protein YozV
MSTDFRSSADGPAVEGRGRPPKNPVLALGLSFLFPGIGQAYNGQPAKAFIFCLAFIGCIYAIVEIQPLPYALLLPFVFFYGLVDAYKSAELINTRRAGGEIEDDTVESPAWGATLMGLGALLLLHNFGWLDLARFHRFWPLVLIVFGGMFLYGSLQRRKTTPGSHGSVDEN